VPAEEDLKWLLNIATSDSWLGMTLTASWFAEYALQEDARPPFGRPLITSIVPDEEFTFDPAVLDYEGVQRVTVTCRGVCVSWYSDLY
jgi:hypothetical protein